MKKLIIWAAVLIPIIVLLAIANWLMVTEYKSTLEQMKASRDAILETALSCGEALSIQAKETQGCTATVYTMGNAKEECGRLVDKAAEGLDTCMANVEFFKDLAAYNEDNLMVCLYDLRVERGQRTDGN